MNRVEALEVLGLDKNATKDQIIENIILLLKRIIQT